MLANLFKWLLIVAVLLGWLNWRAWHLRRAILKWPIVTLGGLLTLVFALVAVLMGRGLAIMYAPPRIKHFLGKLILQVQVKQLGPFLLRRSQLTLHQRQAVTQGLAGALYLCILGPQALLEESTNRSPATPRLIWSARLPRPSEIVIRRKPN
jgi:hypothetical protein